ncbi:MAG: alpha/beta hydrolase-fold protein [Bacteroidota bacterium]
MRQFLLSICFSLVLLVSLKAQEALHHEPGIKHVMNSEYLGEAREYWVSLPFRYADTASYPVIYVLDAEWRFNLTRHIVFDQGGNDIIERAIIVGIPHVEVMEKRGRDLTFSQSRTEYDGDTVDSTWYNSTNSGGGQHFYRYLVEELIPAVNSKYATNGHETLVGHSYGGYFGGYLLSLPHPFEVLHIYDPSIWFSGGEVIDRFKSSLHKESLPVAVHITYQPKPLYHREKIEAFIRELEGTEGITVTKRFYPHLSHNALFVDSFYDGIRLTHRKK